MEAIRRVREHDLLGHAPRDPFSGEEVRQRIGTDFSDVFGGPPRRFSLCETRSSLGESGEDSESGGRLEVEDAGESSQRWSPSLAEKPVFGGFSSPAHRRHLGDDFFSDIFRGNESPCSTPRKLDRERFAATPSSSFLSPSRPLPPTADVFGGDPSTPNLSYSSRLAKNFDYSPFSSPTSRAAQKTEESTPRAFDVPSPNSPSRFTHATDGLATNSRRAPPSHRPAEAAAVPPGDGTRGAENLPMKEDSNSKDNSGSDHLHFSMYKWASKGVTLVMPPNLKERIKGRSRLGGVYAQVSQQPDLPSDKENMPQGIPIFQNQGEPEEKTLFGNPPPAENNKAASPKEAAKVLRDITDQSEDAGVCGKDGSGFSVEARKPGLKNLRHLLDDDLDKEGNEDTSKHAKEREGTAPDSRRATKVTDSTAKPRQGTREEPALDSYEKTNLASHRPVRIKGKVKESMKNFEPRRSGPRENMNGRVEDRPSAQEVNKDEAKGIYEASSVPVAPTGQNLKAERAASFKNSGVQKLDGFFSEVDSDSVTFSDYTINSLDASFNKIEVTDFEHVEDCMLEDLSQDHNEVSEANLHQEEIQKSDAKILEWSKGREGNIRSLLSTLQYVLWPGSGWKPVPLVDIIEAPSVRRAYQRALLYIHPDKLQQKGADIHRKYVAEKVFDILQEAWDHFNSLGAL